MTTEIKNIPNFSNEEIVQIPSNLNTTKTEEVVEKVVTPVITEDRLSGLEEALVNTSTDVSTLTTELEQLKANFASMTSFTSAKVEELNNEIKSLKDSLEQYRNVIEEQNKEISSLKEKITSLENQPKQSSNVTESCSFVSTFKDPTNNQKTRFKIL